eukprot:TRINITY_DN5830_c0_g1_i1.p1 TRINITY_DN5830_c0_g1~~TRINITY_DN5830_c0_g1_i1.p1  ORF type:complete len:357 (-),score=103.75 TRINITY_DN5830_c0_g1_i1:211-1281(-)
MLSIPWSSSSGWGTPSIGPIQPLSLHPASKVLHYAQEIFEGLKAFRGVDDRIRLFRPGHNMARMNLSATRAELPRFSGNEFLSCIRRLVELDAEWVPHYPGCSLYIRPALIGTEPALGVSASSEALLYVILSPVGPYFDRQIQEKGVRLLADSRFTRAYPGGCGYAKMGSNYAPTLWNQAVAVSGGSSQNLWLYGPKDEITEVGAMNIFILIEKPGGEGLELVTPGLEKGIILPGVLRRSVLELEELSAEKGLTLSERVIEMEELTTAIDEGRLVEVFGAGTAATICSVGGIDYNGRLLDIPMDHPKRLSGRIRSIIFDIFYGRVTHPWATDIESWNLEPEASFSDFELAHKHMSL